MDRSVFYQTIIERFNLTQVAIDILDQELYEESLNKGEHIVEQGKRINDIIFLVKGAVLSSFIREDKEYVTNISLEGEIIAIPLRESKISNATLTALEDCVILRISIDKFESLMEKYPELSILGYRIFKKLLGLVAEEYFDFTGLEAKEAYDKILRGRPEIINRIPLKVSIR